jgi:mRNA interferase MazF
MLHPKRGEVWLVDLGLTAKVRPCLVLSAPTHDKDRALITVMAHTTSPRGTKFETEVKVKFLRPGVFDAQNLVTVPQIRLIRKLGMLSPQEMSTIEASVRLWLGL